jgi:hypothetical protein
MWRVENRKRVYSGRIELDVQPLDWIGDHRSFADRAWFESQVRYSFWIEDRNEKNCFRIYVDEFEGRKTIRVLIRIKRFSTHVLVFHAHVLGKKG